MRRHVPNNLNLKSSCEFVEGAHDSFSRQNISDQLQDDCELRSAPKVAKNKQTVFQLQFSVFPVAFPFFFRVTLVAL